MASLKYCSSDHGHSQIHHQSWSTVLDSERRNGRTRITSNYNKITNPIIAVDRKSATKRISAWTAMVRDRSSGEPLRAPAGVLIVGRFDNDVYTNNTHIYKYIFELIYIMCIFMIEKEMMERVFHITILRAGGARNTVCIGDNYILREPNVRDTCPPPTNR